MIKDRKEAAEKLAPMLDRFKPLEPIVLGIPRGGTEVAYLVSKHLGAPMYLAITKRLSLKGKKESTIGALAEDDSLVLTDVAKTTIPKPEINRYIAEAKKEIRKRISLYRKDEELPSLKNRTVIIVDDGVATGNTVMATIELCRNRDAGKIILATPIAGESLCKRLKKKVDEIVVLKTPFFFRSIEQAYKDFEPLNDADVLKIINQYQEEKEGESPSE
ncbi:phosphoribosyltransferase [Litoribacter alkaliphilus]|uniref:Phosphoribosyltransferase n=1 Tax=Litoribacter ruber TaxID=702568 RepID=A0AAP2G642_9BACT|nr:phosphoribosyltransferase family protein [Litoribacter alkaliphilus]MBS9525278.1 phosphoribosyltransferase [Litoribacter alkaliphilus]